VGERTWRKYINVAQVVIELIRALGIKIKFKKKENEKEKDHG